VNARVWLIGEGTPESAEQVCCSVNDIGACLSCWCPFKYYSCG